MSEIEKLKQQIEYWKAGLKMTKSSSQAALLNDKIMEARIKITELQSQTKKEVKDQIDAPVIADRTPSNNGGILTSGKVGDTTIFKMDI